MEIHGVLVALTLYLLGFINNTTILVETIEDLWSWLGRPANDYPLVITIVRPFYSECICCTPEEYIYCEMKARIKVQHYERPRYTSYH